LVTDHHWELPQMPYRRRGGLLRPVLNASKWGAKQLLRTATKDIDLRHFTAEGVIDMTGRRYMLDHRHFARLYADGHQWEGRSGRAIATLAADSDELPTPLWLLDLLGGVTDVVDIGTEDVRGTSCHHVAATVDVSRAAKATRAAVAVPARRRYEDLLALPVDVWIDPTHIRRIRFASSHKLEQRTDTMELWDFGTPIDDLDWTRLPTFRTPCDRHQRRPSRSLAPFRPSRRLAAPRAPVLPAKCGCGRWPGQRRPVGPLRLVGTRPPVVGFARVCG
jgi:hypothetical protein